MQEPQQDPDLDPKYLKSRIRIRKKSFCIHNTGRGVKFSRVSANMVIHLPGLYSE
jgi:hypothetical protein